MINGSYRPQDLYLVVLGDGQPITLHRLLRSRGIILALPYGDVQPQHDSFVAGRLNRERIAHRQRAPAPACRVQRLAGPARNLQGHHPLLRKPYIEGRMTQRLVWPADLQRQEDGSILVSFPDIPEALTEGATEAEALAEAQDCVIAALGGYMEGRHPIPAPSPVRGRTSVALPVLVVAKIALYGATHEQGVDNTAIAERLGLSEGAVRRLIDLDHRSHIGQVETVLHALGQRLTVATRAA